MPPRGVKTAGIKVRERVHYSGVTRLHTFKAECPGGCGTWAQGPNRSIVLRTIGMHAEECAVARKVRDGKADPKDQAKASRAKAKIDTYIPPAQRVGAGAD